MCRVIVIFFTLLLFSSSCIMHDEEKSKEYIPIIGQQVDLVGDASVFKIHYACDSLIITSGFSQTHKLTAYQFNSDTCFSYDFLRIGNGPGEVHSVNVKSHSDTLYVLSYTPIGISEFVSIPLNAIKNADAWKRKSAERALLVGNDFDVLHDGRYLFLGGDFNTRNLMMKFDGVNGIYSPLEFWPDDKYNGSLISKQMIYVNSSLYAGGNKLLYASGEGQYAVILDTAAVGTNEMIIYDEFPKYKMSEDGINWRRLSGCKLGLYACVTDYLIYLAPIESKIVNGRYVPDNYNGYPPYFVDEIDVYNWEGEYMYTYIVDTPLGNFYVNSDENCLYTLTVDLETMASKIMKYDLWQ
ncbi:MAG: hypothetical protein ACI3ZS_01070 [Candidatus Cryptobacteroides sp.]